jgi:hypothetical protein
MDPNALIRSVGRFVAFVLLGVFIAAVGEVQFSVFIRGDVANLIGSMGFNALYLAAWAVVTWLLLRFLGRRPLTILLITALAGFVGLMIEWFVIGNSPWGNPDASNVGMAAYWACMVVVPLALLDTAPTTRRLRRNIVLYGLVYVLLALAVQFLIPNADLRYAYHIWSVVLGYLGLLILTVSGLSRAWSPSSPGPLSPAA